MAEQKKELLFSLTKKDFIVETFRAGGKGGQKQNKTDSAVRIKHPASGAVGESREQRSQHQNKRIAFKRLTETHVFKRWHAMKVQELLSKNPETPEQAVERMMSPDNIKVEIFEDGSWQSETD